MNDAAGNQLSAAASPWQRLRRHFAESFAGEFAYRRHTYDADRLDAMIERRRRDAYRYILLLLAAVLVPVTLHNLYGGEPLPSAAGLILTLVIIANIWLLSRHRDPFLTPPLVLLMSMALVLLLVVAGQEYSIYWLYPLLVALPVLLHSRWSVWVGMACGLIVVPLVFAQFRMGAAIVISISMVLTWLVSTWLVFAVSEQSRHLRNMAVTDPLTGAYNRRYFELQASHARKSWLRSDRRTTLLLIDIDFFKRINDRFGHAAGDTAIRGLVEVISGRIRSVDILCRFGGEEFVLLLSDTGTAAGIQVAEELRHLVEQARILPEGNMTVSIGVCDVSAGDSLDHWLNLADAALYLAKRNGRNRVEVAAPEGLSREPAAITVPSWR